MNTRAPVAASADSRDEASPPNFDRLRTEMIALAARIARRVQLMEVCGTHTVSIFRSGIRSMLPANVRLLSGPGCPVCVTAQRHIDAAMELAEQPGVILATYGDMLRVPGRRGSLERCRAAGADVRVVNSAQRALELAQAHPQRAIVFLGVGFETTAPATAAVVLAAEQSGLENFSVLVSHKRVVPAMRALLDGDDVALDGFLCPGHVSVIIGADAYRGIVSDYAAPCVVCGFEPPQILAGLVHLLRQVADATARLENVYGAVVRPAGNPAALALLEQVFLPAPTPWRELGVIPDSGLELRPRFHRFDAIRRFGLSLGDDHDNPACRCGQVIQGKLDPPDCALYGTACTPLRPIGPCMVSSEGTCAAWYRYAGIHAGARATTPANRGQS